MSCRLRHLGTIHTGELLDYLIHGSSGWDRVSMDRGLLPMGESKGPYLGEVPRHRKKYILYIAQIKKKSELNKKYLAVC